MKIDEASELCGSVIDAVSDSVIADRQFLETVLTGILSKGHVLLEDVPGTGKTLAARSFAQAMGLSFGRIQFTPDMLPSDVTGTQVYNERDSVFEFNEGPIFANMVLADEINRAPPKTQASLLEAMEEKQVTVEGENHPLPEPFFVIATQNPVELEGTFELPEAQLDRFIIKAEMGYPSREGEMELLERRSQRETLSPTTERVVSRDEIAEMQEVPETVTVTEDVRGYIVDICRETRQDSRVGVGVSP
ncbi:MAG: AAA family ATPase, partial [Halobacteria archaeon]|nr:AAA family ATPase [Halobacteria archaeon]